MPNAIKSISLINDTDDNPYWDNPIDKYSQDRRIHSSIKNMPRLFQTLQNNYETNYYHHFH